MARLGTDLADALRETSVATRSLRRARSRQESVRRLQALLDDADHVLAPMWGRWQLDDLVATGDRSGLIEQARFLSNRYGERVFAGRAWGARVGEALISGLLILGDLDSAARVISKRERVGSELLPRVGSYVRLARAAEAGGDEALAVRSYQAAATHPTDRSDPQLQAAARGHHRRVTSGAPWGRPTAADLAESVSAAFFESTPASLQALASQGSFAVGLPLAEPNQVDGRAFASWLHGAVRDSAPTVHIGSLELRQGRRRYLPIFGLDALSPGGAVTIIFDPLRRAEKAWHWVGGVIEKAKDAKDKVEEFIAGCDVERTSSNALDIEIKAPWPSGVQLLAGGIGFGGRYYNHPPTHCLQSAFAVDFATSVGSAHGMPVLSEFDGVVTKAVDGTEDDDTSGSGNIVWVDHYRRIDYLVAELLAAGFANQRSRSERAEARSRYSTRYYHLLGPQLPVSEGMWVPQGVRLGEIDNTGDSFGAHLHFELRDTTELTDDLDDETCATVMLDPIDGVSPGLDDAGTLITSTNVEVD